MRFPRSPPHVLLATILGLLPAPGTRAATPCPTIALVRIDDGVTLFAGTRDPGSEACSSQSSLGHLAAGSPDLPSSASLELNGWTPLVPTGAPTTGIPFSHRGAIWTLDVGDLAPGKIPCYKVLPLQTERGLPGNKLECLEHAQDIAVATFDRWSFAIVEQDRDGYVGIRRIGSTGPDIEMETESTEPLATGWPTGTRLLSVDAFAKTGETMPHDLAAFGRATDGSVHVATRSGETFPPLPIDPRASVAGAWLASGPAIVDALDGSLGLHAWAGSAWRDAGSVRLPAGAPSSFLTPAMALAAAGADRRVAVAALAGDGVIVATHDGSAWTDVRMLETKSRPAMSERPDGPAPAPRRPLLALGIIALVTLSAVMIAVHHLRLKLRSR